MVYGYARVSTDKQDVRQQEHTIYRTAAAHGLEVGKMVAETIKSGEKVRALHGLISQLKSGDVVIAPEMTRFARDAAELLRMTDEFNQRGVRVIFSRENIDLSDTSPMTRLFITILAAMAEFEKARTKERTRAALKAREESGKPLGRPEGAKNKAKKLDGKDRQIADLLKAKVAKSAIARVLGVSRNTLDSFIAEKGLAA